MSLCVSASGRGGWGESVAGQASLHGHQMLGRAGSDQADPDTAWCLGHHRRLSPDIYPAGASPLSLPRGCDDGHNSVQFAYI